MNTEKLEIMNMDDLQTFMNIYEEKQYSLRQKLQETKIKYLTLEIETNAIQDISLEITKIFFRRLHQEEYKNNNNKE